MRSSATHQRFQNLARICQPGYCARAVKFRVLVDVAAPRDGLRQQFRQPAVDLGINTAQRLPRRACSVLSRTAGTGLGRGAGVLVTARNKMRRGAAPRLPCRRVEGPGATPPSYRSRPPSW
jgi:hypothetical protein